MLIASALGIAALELGRGSSALCSLDLKGAYILEVLVNS